MEIDWTVFDGDPEDILTCACGARFMGHCKAVYQGGERGMYSRVPCPACGSTDKIRGASSAGWESQSIRG